VPTRLSVILLLEQDEAALEELACHLRRRFPEARVLASSTFSDVETVLDVFHPKVMLLNCRAADPPTLELLCGLVRRVPDAVHVFATSAGEAIPPTLAGLASSSLVVEKPYHLEQVERVIRQALSADDAAPPPSRERAPAPSAAVTAGPATINRHALANKVNALYSALRMLEEDLRASDGKPGDLRRIHDEYFADLWQTLSEVTALLGGSKATGPGSRRS
jgi:hypothetical protein